MSTPILRFILSVALSSVATSTLSLHDALPIWTIDTPVGRFGYAEIDYTMMIHVGPGPRVPDRYVYLGPLGRVGALSFAFATVVFGSGALFWVVSRCRRQAHDNAA